MSCVAELNAMSQRKARLYRTKLPAGSVNATPASPAPTSNCMLMIQKRFVFRLSTSGLHKGLITQGKYNQLV